ncbi:hypothetical protein BK022_15700 [Methylorubrum extorquens]|uniref:Uncharacterized protein n=1 Tax=Methylorubrum extorquens TaxID=408 RepID=A0A1S1P3Q6_METEX|nr:hypothetical protein BK022_15700 [Methylorubrum extorquens]
MHFVWQLQAEALALTSEGRYSATGPFFELSRPAVCALASLQSEQNDSVLPRSINRLPLSSRLSVEK